MNTKLLIRNALFLSVFLGAALMPYQDVVAQGDRPLSTPDRRVSRELWDIWRQGFDYYEKGEMKMISGKYTESLPFYQKSLDAFKEVKRQNPQWNRSVIEYRMNLCRRRLLAAKRHAEEAAQEQREALARSRVKIPSLPAQDQNTATTRIARRDFELQMEKVSRENELRKRQISELQNELARLRPDVAKADSALKQIRSLMAERDQLDRQLASLKLQFRKLQEEQQKSTPKTAELQRLLASEQSRSTAYQNAFRKRSEAYNKLEEQFRTLQNEKINQETKYAELSKKYAAELQSSSSMVQKNASRMQSLNNQLVQAEKKYSALTKELAEKDKLLNESSAELRKLRAGNISSADTAKRIETEAAALRTENQKVRQELEKIRTAHSNLENRSNALNNEITRLKKELVVNIEQRNDYAKANDAISKQFGELEKMFKKTMAENKSLHTALDKAVKERELFASKVNDQLNESLKTQLAASKHDAEQLTKELKALKQYGNPSELKAKIAIAERKLLRTNTEKAEIERKSLQFAQQYQKAAADLKTRQQEIANLNTKIEQLQKDSNQLAGKLKQQQDENIKLAADAKIKEESSSKQILVLRAREKSLQASLNQELQKQQKTAENNIQKFTQQNNLILKLTNELKSSNDQLADLNSAGEKLKLQQKELTAQLEAEKSKSANTIQTIRTQLSANEKMNQELKNQQSTLNRRLSTLQNDYVRLQKVNEDLKQNNGLLVLREKTLKLEMDSVTRNRDSLQVKQAELEKNINDLMQKNTVLAKDLNLQSEKNKKIQIQLTSANEKSAQDTEKLNNQLKKMQNLQADNTQLQKDAQLLRQQMTKITQSETKENAKVAALLSQIQILQTRFAAAEKSKTDLTLQNEKLETKQSAQQQKIAVLEKQLAEFGPKEKSILQKQLEDAKKDVLQLNSRLTDAKKALADKEVALRTFENQNMLSAEAKKQLSAKETTILEQSKQLAEYRKKADDAQRQIMEKDRTVLGLTQKLNNVSAQNEKLLKETNALSKEQLAEKEKTVLQLTQKLSATQQQLTEAQKKLALIPAQIKKYEMSEADKKRMNDLQKELLQAKAELLKNTESIQKNKNALFIAEQRSEMLAVRLKASKRQIDSLQNDLALAKADISKETSKNLQANTQTKEKLAEAELKLTEIRKQLMEKETELTNLKNRFEEKTKQNAEIEKQLNSAKMEIAALNIRIKNASSLSDESRKDAAGIRKELADKTKETNRLNKEIASLQNVLREVGAERTQLAKELDNLKRTLPGVQELANANKAREKAETTAKKLTYEKTSMETTIAELQARLGSTQNALEKSKRSLQTRNNDVQRLTLSLAEFESMRKEYSRLKQALAVSKEETKLAVRNAKLSEANLKLEIRKQASQVLTLRDENAKNREQITAMTAKQKSLEKTAGDYELQVTHLKKELAKALSAEERIKLQKRIDELNKSMKVLASGTPDELVREAANKNLVINDLLSEQQVRKDDIRKLNNAVETYRIQLVRQQEKVDKAEDAARLAVFDARKSRAELKFCKLSLEDKGIRMPNAPVPAEQEINLSSPKAKGKVKVSSAATKPAEKAVTANKAQSKPKIAAPKNTKEYEVAMERGIAAEKSGDLGMALWHYWQAIDAMPDNAEPYMALCKLHIKRKERESAFKMYQKACKISHKTEPEIEAQINKL